MERATTPSEESARFARTGEELGGRPVDAVIAAELDRRDLVRWGPIAAGLVTVLATMAVGSTLGLAVGLSAVEPTGAAIADITTGAWIWAIATSAIAFFLGGFVAGMSAAVRGRRRGLLNGLMVGTSAIAATLVLIGFGAGALLGAGPRALSEIINVGQQIDFGQSPDAASNAFEQAENNAWATFIALVLAIALAGLGGFVARGEERDVPRRR